MSRYSWGILVAILMLLFGAYVAENYIDRPKIRLAGSVMVLSGAILAIYISRKNRKRVD